MFGEDVGRLDEAVGGAGGLQFDRGVLDTGLADQCLRLVQVQTALGGKVGRVVLGVFAEQVVSYDAGATEHGTDEFFPVDESEHRPPQVEIVEGRTVHLHREPGHRAAGRTQNLHPGIGLVGPRRGDPPEVVGVLHLPTQQGVDSCGFVRGREDLEFFDVGGSTVPIVGESLGDERSAWLEGGERERSGSDRPAEIRRAVGDDVRAERCQHVRKITARAFAYEFDGVVVDLAGSCDVDHFE